MTISTRYLGKTLDMNHMLAFFNCSQHMNQVPQNTSAYDQMPFNVINILFRNISELL